MSGSSTLKLSSPNGPFIADEINKGTRCSVVGIEIRPKGFNGYRVSFAGSIAASGEYRAIPSLIVCTLMACTRKTLPLRSRKLMIQKTKEN